MRRPGLRHFLILSLITAVLAVVTPVGAQAYASPENKLGHSACGWAASSTVTVGIDPAFPFPDADYSTRLDEAITRWNAVLSGAPRPITVARSDAGPDVVVQYRSTESADPAEAADVLGETYLQREGDADLSADIGRCPDRRAAVYAMKAAQIRINPRNDWYAGDDSTLSTWEMCDGSGFRTANSELCSHQVDFPSTMAHEIGHAMVFYHPQTLDAIDSIPVERSDSASSAAKCVEATGTFTAQATMCAGQGMWRAEQRTLEVWDTDTATRQYS